MKPNICINFDSAVPPLDWNILNKDVYTGMFIAALFIVAPSWNMKMLIISKMDNCDIFTKRTMYGHENNLSLYTAIMMTKTNIMLSKERHKVHIVWLHTYKEKKQAKLIYALSNHSYGGMRKGRSKGKQTEY